MTSNIIYTRLPINIASGEQGVSDTISLEQGKCVGIYFVPFKDPKPEFAVEIEIKYGQGGTLLNMTDYRDYKHGGGGYFAGMKQVSFPTKNNRFSVNVTAEKPLTDDFSGQLIFVIQRDCESCE